MRACVGTVVIRKLALDFGEVLHVNGGLDQYKSFFSFFKKSKVPLGINQ